MEVKLVEIKVTTERGVTANIPVLGTGDSGFESRRSDHCMLKWDESL